MSYSAAARNPQIVTTNDGRGEVFVCWICVLDESSEVVVREQFTWLLDHRQVDTATLQGHIDRRKANLVQRVENRARINVGAIS